MFCVSIRQLIFFLIAAGSLIQYQNSLGTEKDVILVEGTSSLPRKVRLMEVTRSWVKTRQSS